MSDALREAAQALLTRLDRESAHMGRCVPCGMLPRASGHAMDCPVLVLRAALADGVAAGPQATPGQVLWEGPAPAVVGPQGQPLPGSHLVVSLPGVQPGTRLQVVAAPTGQEEAHRPDLSGGDWDR